MATEYPGGWNNTIFLKMRANDVIVLATSAHEVFCVRMMKNNEYINLPDEEPIMPGPVLLVVMVARSSYMQKC